MATRINAYKLAEGSWIPRLYRRGASGPLYFGACIAPTRAEAIARARRYQCARALNFAARAIAGDFDADSAGPVAPGMDA